VIVVHRIPKVAVAFAALVLAACAAGQPPSGSSPEQRAIEVAALRADPAAAAALARDFERLAFADPALGTRRAQGLMKLPLPIVIAPNEEASATDRAIVAQTAANLRNGAGLNLALDQPRGLPWVYSEREGRRTGTWVLVTFMNRNDLARSLTDAGLITSNEVATAVATGCLSLTFSRDDEVLVLLFVRSDQSPTARGYCVNREMAGLLGLPGFLPRPDSIFSETAQIGAFTARDLVLLRMVYDPRLRAGMTAAQARPLLPAVAADALAR
jgi:hypothetical protein